MKPVRTRALTLLVALLFTSACTFTIGGPTPTPTQPPTATSSPTPIPPTSTSTSTPTKIPPTPTDTPLPIILTDGTQQWYITSVAISETSRYTPPAGFYLTPGFVYLTIEFKPQGNADIVSAVMQMDVAGIISFSLPAGIKMVYVTDSENNKYHAVEVAQDHLIIPVKENTSGFTLYVLDWEPVDLGK